jgi:hypothetical protein
VAVALAIAVGLRIKEVFHWRCCLKKRQDEFRLTWRCCFIKKKNERDGSELNTVVSNTNQSFDNLSEEPSRSPRQTAGWNHVEGDPYEVIETVETGQHGPAYGNIPHASRHQHGHNLMHTSRVTEHKQGRFQHTQYQEYVYSNERFAEPHNTRDPTSQAHQSQADDYYVVIPDHPRHLAVDVRESPRHGVVVNAEFRHIADVTRPGQLYSNITCNAIPHIDNAAAGSALPTQDGAYYYNSASPPQESNSYETL